MSKNIFLLSDQVIHWNIFPGEGRKNVFMEKWGNESIKRLITLLAIYFKNKAKPLDWVIVGEDTDSQDKINLNPADAAYNHVFATWKLFPEGKGKAWRIDEINHVGQGPEFIEASPKVDELAQADLLIIQDWGMKIHDFNIPELSDILQDKWVIFRPYPPVFSEPLWHSAFQQAGQKEILVLRADDLRMLDTSISMGVSWEQTLQDLITEIYCKKNISLYPLQQAAYVVISFGHTGTLLLHNWPSHKGDDPEILFFFDSMSVEGHWEVEHSGYLPGSLELLLVLLAKEVMAEDTSENLNLAPAIRAHILGSRALHFAGADSSEGSLNLGILPNELDKIYGTVPSQVFSPVPLDFDHFNCLYQARQDDSLTIRSDWSLLSRTKWDFYSLARRIALSGPMNALQGLNIPIAKYNHLLTVDRKEIEFLHHLQTLFTEYLQKRNSQPLSIAVFGSPGSGKSFSIKQLAKSLGLPGYELQAITFNLSQFNVDNPSDLYHAFHAVRDISLSGKIPLVFWDEFDSNNLAWLRYFLAPMEDGEFQEGQLTHNIGKSIFVFAGGTCSSMGQFEVKAQKAVAEKGPDFLSRIKGFINVMGPNPVLPFEQNKSDSMNREDETNEFIQAKNADPEFIIRRAILLNSLLHIGNSELFKGGELQIDDGVLNAFLLIPKYKHGSRSMQTIFKISQLYGKHKFNRSDLPPQSQMDLHVDGELFYDLVSQHPKYFEGGEAFYHLVNEIDLDEAVIDKMAAGIHAIYDLVFESGKVDNPVSITKDEFLEHYAKMQTLPEGLPQDEISQNYHNARKIPEKLAAVGFMIAPITSKEAAGSLTEEEFEKVSRLEHIRWVRHHIDNGWHYAPVKNKAMKEHDALVPWDEEERQKVETVYGVSYTQRMGISDGNVLSEHYRNLDRVITMAIPWILECVGYKMVRAEKR